MASIYFKPSYGAGGSGTQLAPYDSFADHTQAANDVLYLSRGETFNEALTIAQNGVTVTTYGTGELPIIDGQNTRASGLISGNRTDATYENFITRNHTSYGVNFYGSRITFNNVTAHANSVGFFTNTGVTNISDITFNDCIAYSNTTRGWQHVLQGAYSTTNLTLDGCSSYNNTTDGAIIGQSGGSPTAILTNTIVRNSVFYGNGNIGLYLVNSVASSYKNTLTLVHNVNSYSNGVCGIYVQGLSNSRIRSSKTYLNGTLGTLGGIWCGNNQYLVVESNESYDNVSTTIDGAGIFDDQLNDNCTFRFNKVYRNTGGSSEESGFGIAVYNSRNTKHYGNISFSNRHGYFFGHASSVNLQVYNCTIVGSTVSNIRLFGGASAVPNGELTIKNVISHSPGTYHIYRPTANTFVSNYNCFYPVSGSQFYTDAGAVSYATWQGGGSDANSITSNPLLDVNYRPTASSPCLGAGTYIAGTRYFGGETVRGTPDIGAKKYHTPRSIDSSRTLRA